jgi:hypothetical protein
MDQAAEQRRTSREPATSRSNNPTTSMCAAAFAETDPPLDIAEPQSKPCKPSTAQIFRCQGDAIGPNQFRIIAPLCRGRIGCPQAAVGQPVAGGGLSSTVCAH